jgi:hypothetical protein
MRTNSRRDWDEQSRDSRGRYAENDHGYSNRDEDYNDNYQGRGGWSGDSEGHSEAAERGWQNRRGGSQRSYDRDDDRDYGQGRGGWYGDREGHSEAAESGWENRGRGYDRDYDYDDNNDYNSEYESGRGRSSQRGSGGYGRDHKGSHSSRRNNSRRGFAAMDSEEQREIAHKGGVAAHRSGHAHEWDSEEARRAGHLGGLARWGSRSSRHHSYQK